MSQKFTFTKKNLVQIGKGAGIAAAGAAALFLLNFLGALEISDPLIASAVAWFVPTAVNAIRQYLKDE